MNLIKVIAFESDVDPEDDETDETDGTPLYVNPAHVIAISPIDGRPEYCELIMIDGTEILVAGAIETIVDQFRSAK
jgi:hypothetical protein